MNSQTWLMHSTTIDNIMGQSAWNLQGMGGGGFSNKKKKKRMLLIGYMISCTTFILKYMTFLVLHLLINVINFVWERDIISCFKKFP